MEANWIARQIRPVKVSHISCCFQSVVCYRDCHDTTRSNFYHISHHVAIIHLITHPIKLAQHCQAVWIQFFFRFPPLSLNDYVFSFVCFLFSWLVFLPLFFSLGCLSRVALIKHGVGGGTESSSRAEEKGSNSSSQDGTLTHNGSAILFAPHRFLTESPLLRQLFNRPPLIQHTHTHTHNTFTNTHASAHANTHAPMWQLTCTRYTQTYTHKPLTPCVCLSLVLQLTLLWAFWSAPKARWQPFYFSHHAEAQPLS